MARDIRPNVQAMDNASTGNRPAPTTPNPELSKQVAEKIAAKEQAGYNAPQIAKDMTKDDYTRG